MDESLSLKESLLHVLMNFKVKHAPERDSGAELGLFDDPMDTFGYWTTEDKRRRPFLASSEDSESKQLAYSHFTRDIDTNGCLNDMEYLFHPLNYKTSQCPSNVCERKYCPFYHSSQEKDVAAALITGVQRVDVLNDIMKTIETLKGVNDELAASVESVKNRPRLTSGIISIVGGVQDEDRDLSLNKTPNRFHNRNGYYPKKAKKATLLANGKADSMFFYNQEVQMFEDINHEFKNFTQLDVKVVTNYICGFLNSFGGKLYFGINNDGFVKGMYLNRQDIDQFQIDLDISLRRFQPEIFPDQILVKFHEVCSDSSKRFVQANKYVVEIEIKPPLDSSDIFINNNWECYIKRSGSLNCLTVPEIM